MLLKFIIGNFFHVGGVSPFNAHQNPYIGPRFFGYNSPAAAAREVFKPSTDAGRLFGSIFKKIF